MDLSPERLYSVCHTNAVALLVDTSPWNMVSDLLFQYTVILDHGKLNFSEKGKLKSVEQEQNVFYRWDKI